MIVRRGALLNTGRRATTHLTGTSCPNDHEPPAHHEPRDLPYDHFLELLRRQYGYFKEADK